MNPLKQALRKSRPIFLAVALFSAAINILMLTGPLFMLQVYDRVLSSRSVPTLVVLFGLVAGLFICLGIFDFLRSKALSRAGYRLDMELMGLVKKVWIFAGLGMGVSRARPVKDLATIRQFLCSAGLPAFFDLPWVPLYLVIVFMLHTWLGLLASAGAVIVIVATIINEWITKSPIAEATGWEIQDATFAEAANRNAEAVIAMGMTGKVTDYWKNLRQNALGFGQRAAARSGFITSFTKAVRMLLQSSMLALGAWLAIKQEISAGTIIASSIISGRALAPIDLAVGNWKNFIRARQAYSRLNQILESAGQKQPPVQLPAPKAELSISNVYKLGLIDAVTGESKPILQGIHFDLHVGDGLGVIGPSASGKSSLARLLVGLWMPDRGTVRLDGAVFDQWDRDELGKYIGYLPQSVEMIGGTIRQNISRFDDDVADEELVAAAKLAGVHDLILKLPDGYSTRIGDGGYVLSGGQEQRIALARAVLRTPPLVVLDEPNANLDAEGDAALTNAIAGLRQAGSCVVVMAHRPSAIAAVNKVLMLSDGQQVEFGNKQEVLEKVTRPASASTKLRSAQ